MALLRAALTGGIATGKSYVRTRLAARAAGHDHPIEVAIAARLVEQRDVDDGQALAGGGETIEPRAGRLADARLADRFEIGTGLRVPEHHDAEGAAIEAAVGQEDVGPEALGHGRQARRAARDGVARQHVRVEAGVPRFGPPRLLFRLPPMPDASRHYAPLPGGRGFVVLADEPPAPQRLRALLNWRAAAPR